MPASDSSPPGSTLTLARRIAADSSPPDRRWIKPAGSLLTHARRIAADSCPPAAANPSPHVTARRAMFVSCCAHRNILIKSCLVLSTETRLGQVAPLVVAAEAILAACPLVVDMEAVAEGPCKGPWLLVMPRGSLSFQASPGGLLVPVGCPVLFVWPWKVFLSCHVLSCLSSLRGLLIPPDFPRELFLLGGG